ncbi:MAG: glutamate racemase [Bacteroidales bacterium]|jgi:glutamate racemase|nr:glutamate racemase [Bacteroidales bacterium]
MAKCLLAYKGIKSDNYINILQRMNKQAIGIFDSGLGGLTVASAIKQILPEEKLIYFGDTAHLPYGDKSSSSIIHYSEKIADFLLKKNVKVILIACNTASALAYSFLKEYVGDRAIVLNVIDPVVDYISKNYAHSNIGVIGTKGTINSNTYQNKIQDKNVGVKLFSKATPLFVPMIEEGFIYDNISNAIIHSYLSVNELKDIQALILGCTHFPIIKNQIRKFYDFKVDVVDSAHIVASYLKDILEEKEMLNSKRNSENEFYISDYTQYFEVIAKMFFEKQINLTKRNIWNQ